MSRRPPVEDTAAVSSAAVSSAAVSSAVVVGAALLATALYVSLTSSAFGFPLDDGWIHQTYARNLAAAGRWEFVPGVVSAGSTAPLWTLWLALGHAIGAPLFAWAFASGALALGGLGLAAMALWRRLPGAPSETAVVAGLVAVSTWPLVWSAASGMETTLFTALALALCAAALADGTGRAPRGWFGLGIGAALLVLARPEGVGLAGLLLAGLVANWRGTGARHVLRRVGTFLLGLALPLAPYFLFNAWSSGTLWPNTFYAKQAEYAALLAAPWWSRLWRLLLVSWGGPSGEVFGVGAAHLLLVPGGLWAGWLALRADWRGRRLRVALPLCWAGGLVALYAWRLPVTFQHGRYLMAAMPVWVVYGLFGWGRLLAGLTRRRARAGWLVARVAAGSFLIVQLALVGLGARQYAVDVAFIQGEMVATALWLRAETPADALVAAHDIGAIGYFAERPLLDLAGLVSPDIVPLLGDEERLAAYVLASPAAYLVTAPGWPYEALISSGEATRIYQTDYLWTRRQGQNNMAVYRLDR